MNRQDHPRREFGVLDAMALVAATAAGMAWMRSNYDWQFFFGTWGLFYRNGDVLQTGGYLIRFLWPFLLAWTLTVLVLRSRRPRPPRRLLMRQPGLVACCAATLGTMVCFWPSLVGVLAGVPLIDSVTRGPSRFWQESATGDGAAEAIGLAVATAWLTLVLTRGWHPEPTWVDRLGRILGACWILLLLVSGMLRTGFLLGSSEAWPPAGHRQGQAVRLPLL
jgi:hypothetical protein